jgi:very-short-patch-repair endonuclease
LTNQSEYFRRKFLLLRERKKLARNRIRELKNNPTKYERILQRKLDKAGYKYVFQKAFFNEWYFCIVDFFLRRHKIVVELDGRQHVEDINQVKKDIGHEKYLFSLGFNVIRLSNEEANNITIKKLKKLINDNSKM